jgi:hypothetical protein
MSDLEVTFIDWLNIDNLEMELIEFQESSTWVNKFVKLGEALEEMSVLLMLNTLSRSHRT